eukprot:4917554-Pyramimonas_sp.AAC.1
MLCLAPARLWKRLCSSCASRLTDVCFALSNYLAIVVQAQSTAQNINNLDSNVTWFTFGEGVTPSPTPPPLGLNWRGAGARD